MNELFLEKLNNHFKKVSFIKNIEGKQCEYSVALNVLHPLKLKLEVQFDNHENKETFLPTFSLKGDMGQLMNIVGHVYRDGQICHNFAQKYIANNEKEINEYAEKYFVSVSKLLSSLYLNSGKSAILSTLPENDLSEYERVRVGFYYIIDSSLSEKDLDKAFENNVGFWYKEVPVHNTKQMYSRKILAPLHVLGMRDEGVGKTKCLRVINKINSETYQFKHDTNDMKIIGNIVSNRINVSSVKKPKKIALLGLGSIGSFIVRNLVRDISISSIMVNDPDIYTLKNTYRSAFGNASHGLKKWDLVEKLHPNWINFLADKDGNLFPKKEIDYQELLIAQRNRTDDIKTLIEKLDKYDYIIDATGSDEVFKCIAKEVDKPIFKIALYDSGRQAILGKFMPEDDSDKFSKDWEELKNSNKLMAESAYNSEDPANFSRTELFASLFYSYIKNELENDEKKTEVRLLNERNLFR